ncbi:MAG: tape measure protein [Bacteroidota bacterium]
MAVRRDQYQLDIQFITDESRAFARTVKDNRQFIADLKNAQKEGKGVAEVMSRIAANGKQVQGLDLTRVAPAQLIARARQLNRVLQQIPESAPGYSQLNNELSTINNRLAQLRQRSRGVASSGARLNSFFGSLRSRFIGITAAAGALIGSLRAITNTASNFQRFEAVLTNALGDRSAARGVIDQLTEFAARTPFQLEELIGSYVKFVNRGLKPTQDELENFADLAASQGKSFDQLTEAILDAGTGEFERLKEFGITAKTTGDQVVLSFKDQEVQVAKTQEAITAALVGFGDLNGVQGSTAAISQTLAGRISNLQDTFTRLFRNLGEGFIGNTIGQAIELVSKLANGLADLTEPTRDATKETRQLQAAFNIEIDTLQNANLSQENRNNLITEINSKYGEYLPNLIKETDTYDQLEATQNAVNDAFRQRIILIAAEDQLVQVAQKQVEAKQEELQLARELTEVESRAAAARNTPDGNQQFAGTTASRTILSDGQIAGARRAVEENKKLQAELQATFEESIKAAQELGLNIGNILSPPEEGGVTGGGSGGQRKSIADRLKEAIDEAIKQYAIQEQELEQSFLRQEISESEYNRRLLELQKDGYAEQLRIYEQFNQQRSLAAQQARTEFLRLEAQLTRDDRAPVQPLQRQPEQVQRRGIDAGLDRVAQEEERALGRLQNALTAQAINQEQFELGRLELRKQTLEAEQEILRQGNEEELLLAAEKRDQIAEIDQQIFDKKRDLSERRIALEQQVNQAQGDALSAGVDLTTQILGRDEEARKRNAGVIKAFEAGRIVVAGLSEISQIRLSAAAQAAINPLLAPVFAARATAQSIAAGIRTAAGVAQVLSAKFAQGGIAKFGYFGGKPHSQGGTKGFFDDGTVIEVEKDEAFAVVNKRSSGLLKQLSTINQAGGGVPFFEGGGIIAPSTTPVAGLGSSGLNDGAMLAEMRSLGQLFSSFPTRLRAEVVYTDIEDVGSELSTVRSASEA